jgi:hypothetical protein
MQRVIGRFDPASLTFPWSHPDPAVDALQRDVMALVTSAGSSGRAATFAAIWSLAHARAGLPAAELNAAAERPAAFISEPWYCCAEPAEFHL